MRTAVAALMALALVVTVGGNAARTADWTLVLDGGAPTGQPQCPGPFTVSIFNGVATSSEYGYGTFASTITVRIVGTTLEHYDETFEATFGGVIVGGRSQRDPSQTYTASCTGQTFSLQGTMRTTITSPTTRSGLSKVVLNNSNHLNDFTADPPAPVDADGDGVSPPADCNDANAAIRPGAAEIPGNAVDENCDGIAEPAPVVDGDGDGVPAGSDCNDRNPAVRPGAAEIRGNTIDENCDGLAAPFLTLRSTIRSAWLALRRETVVRRLEVLTIPAGATVTVTCAPRCAFRQSRRAFSRASARLELTTLFRRRPLRVGTLITVRITAPETMGKHVGYMVRRSRQPSTRTLCLPPGGRPRSC